MKVTIEDAISISIDKLVRNGVPLQEAEVAAPIFLEGELWGKRTHGFRYLAVSLELYHSGDKHRRAMRVERETGVSALIDGGFHFPQFIHAMGMKRAIEKAKNGGLGMVAVHNTGTSGLLGYYSQLATQAGLIGVVINGTPPAVVPPHGVVPMLGTNPLTIGIPQTKRAPLILDMSTSSITYNELMQAQRENRQLPPGVAVDKDGNPTTDPHAALDETHHTRIVPFAGYKGFGLSLMIELLSSAGLGTSVGMNKWGTPLNNAAHGTGIYLAYRPDLFVERDVFDVQVAQLVEDIKSNYKAEDTTAIRLPGEQSQQHKAAALQAGYLEIEESTYVFLRA